MPAAAPDTTGIATIRARFVLGIIALAAMGGCATSDANREPMLTNPARYSKWVGDDVELQLSSPASTEQVFKGKSYDGNLRFPLTEDWSWQLADPGQWSISRMELGSPVVAGAHVLVGNSRAPGLLVLDRNTGRALKTVPMTGPVQATPVALNDGWLVVDVFGHLQRLDSEYEPVWPKGYDCDAGVFRSPIVDGEQILIATGNDQVISVGLSDGAWQWSHKRTISRTEQDLAILGAPSPAVVGDAVLQGFSDGYVVAINRTNGAELWSVPVGDGRFPDIQAEVLEHDGMLIMAAFGGPTLAIDAETRSVRWKVDSGAVSSMALTPDSLYISSGRGAVVAIDPNTGIIQWRWEPKDKQLGPPVRVGASLLVGDSSGTLHALNRHEGTEIWRYRPMDGSRLNGVAAAATVSDRQVLFVSAGGTLHSLVGTASHVDDLSEEPRVRRDRLLGW